MTPAADGLSTSSGQRLLLGVACLGYVPFAAGLLLAVVAVGVGLDPVVPAVAGLLLGGVAVERRVARVRVRVEDGRVLVHNATGTTAVPVSAVQDLVDHVLPWGRGATCTALRLEDGRTLPVHATVGGSDAQAARGRTALRRLLDRALGGS